ncbi:MAG: hypothetical protein DDT30_01170 [Dehalococcoidia bacterium]|nr:hypothetical protein [Bacillota bacterium]MBT9142645.1 hypothetical protein [Bacillota bacterium]
MEAYSSSTSLKNYTARAFTSPILPLKSSSPSSSSISGIWMSAPCAETTKSTPMCLATSSKSTSTRSRWGPTTPKRILPDISARIPLSRGFSISPGRSAESPLRANHPSGNCSRLIPTATSIPQSSGEWGCLCRRKLPPVSVMSPNEPSGTDPRRRNMPCLQRSGARWWRGANAAKRYGPNSWKAKSARSMISLPLTWIFASLPRT